MSGKKSLALGGEPRVFLLPPEAAQREKARGARRLSVLLLVLVVVLVGAGYGYAFSLNSSAQDSLTQAQAQSAALVKQRKQYSKATAVASKVSDVTDAKRLGASTEVLWSDLISAVRGSLPDGVLIESATMTGRAPWQPELLPAGPLREPRVATLTFVISSPTILDATAIVRSLVDVPGFADATPDSVTKADGIYSTTVTLNVDKRALSNRFADDAKEASK
ncbi:hypothetical protein [Parafrigoribacterium humi]|jgi:hypothetical protein|uniref:hypothetical protein n=1 Tax=Parafrigoribacterium humi TaxID=3144664 RepID=UPI0032EE4EFA